MQETPGGSLAPEVLRTRSDPADIPFETTAELEGLTEIPGQERAREALHFAAGIRVNGHNVYLMGRSGSGRHEFVRQFLEHEAAERGVPHDWVYVYNFADPRQPRALSLPPGRSKELRDDLAQIIGDARTAIPAAFESEDFQAQRESIAEELKEAQESAFREIEEEAKSHDVGVLQTPTGIAFVPVREGEALSPEEFKALPEAEQEAFNENIGRLTQRLQAAMRSMPKRASETRRQIHQLEREVAGLAVAGLVEDLVEKYADLPDVTAHLERMREDIVDNVALFLSQQESTPGPEAAQLSAEAMQSGPERRYAVNVLTNHKDAEGAPVVFSDRPTFPDILGRVEHETEFGSLVTHFMLIRPGALHAANGGYLVLDAEKLLTYPQAWDGLKRALKSRELRIRSLADEIGMVNTVTLDPEPIPLEVKVVLIGERRYYYLLAEYDPEFSELFKVQADFEDEMVRSKTNIELMARWLATIVRREDLKHLSREGMARLVEENSRRAGDSERLSTDLHYATDLLREGHYWARQHGSDVIGAAEIQLAVDARVRRGSRVRDRMQEELLRETMRVETEGSRVGQVNGLAVLQLGDIAFGRPQRITATVTLGAGKVVDIEREVKLGGALHSKGVLILSGFLRSHYLPNRPLSLHASLVFEQSYGGVDGDSASAAELCVLLSALSGVPLRQHFAITGSVDQHGRVQAIGGVNAKIEGFFDICRKRGLTGNQAVVIPKANVKHLMLRQDVLDAVSDERFAVYAVDHVDQAIEHLTGMTAGERDADGAFPEGSFNHAVRSRLIELSGYRERLLGRRGQADESP